MRPTLHLGIALGLVALAAIVAVPPVLDLGRELPVPTEQLTVPPDRARPTLATADRALRPVEPAHAGLPMGNPFSLRERGRTAQLPVPEPPPPLLTLPQPPSTPFAAPAR